MPGKEIIGLKIKQGTLIGSEQQTATANEIDSSPSSSQKEQWYCVGVIHPKEDLNKCNLVAQVTEDNVDTSVEYFHFDQWKDALKKWEKVKNECKLKLGRSGVLFDCQKLVKLKEVGNQVGIKECLEKAKEKGIYAERKEEEVSFTQTIITLYKLLSSKRDFYMMMWIMLLLGLSTYLDLESQLLTGQVMGVVGDIHNNTLVRENWYARKTCEYFVNCDAESVNDFLLI